MDTTTICITLFMIGAFLGLLATVKDGFMYATGRKAYKPWLSPDDPLNQRIGKNIALTGLGFLFGIFCVLFLGNFGQVVLIGASIGFVVAFANILMTWNTQRAIDKLNVSEGQEHYEQE